MPKANEIANELRKLADALDKEPEAELEQPSVLFYHWGEGQKDKFLNLARLMPRPFEKQYAGDDLKIVRDAGAIRVSGMINRTAVCEMVEPAKPAVYRCDPILSETEEAEIVG